MKSILVLVFVTLSAMGASNASKPAVESGSKVFIAPMEGGFNTYLIAAFSKKGVPLTVVGDREKADYEITGAAESQKAGWAKVLLTRQTGSTEEASINVVNIKSGEVVFAYAVNKASSVHGKQSSAEACAKHLKGRIEGKE